MNQPSSYMLTVRDVSFGRRGGVTKRIRCTGCRRSVALFLAQFAMWPLLVARRFGGGGDSVESLHGGFVLTENGIGF